MKLAKALSILAVLVLMAGVSGAAMAQDEPAVYAGHLYYDFGTGAMYTPGNTQVELAGDVYNNTNPQAPANFGIASTSATAQWGDRLATTGTGVLQENDFTIYNSSGGTGSLLTVSFNIALFDATTLAPLASYTTGTVNFGTGLTPGQFSIITVTGLGGLNALIPTTDVLMTQQIAAKTGTATSLGVASLDPPTIGSSTNTMYINASTVGPAGYYNVGNPVRNANPGYRVNLAQPVPAATKSWGAIKAIYHN